jgi:hypothetical protein
VNLKKIAGLLWLSIPPMVLSALIHMADPDIAGWQGLASKPALFSVFLLAVLGVGCVLVCLAVLVEYGWSAFAIASGVFATVSGLLLASFGSGATTFLGVAWTFLSSSLLVLVFVLIAVTPAAALWLSTSPVDTD